METWGTTQLYHFIQRVAQKSERFHSELEKKCEQQQQQISMLTEEHEQLKTEKGQLQEQLETVTRVFRDVWPTVTANSSQILEEMQETDAVGQEFYLKVAYSNLQQENVELKAVLVARPALPDPMVVYSTQISEIYGQVTKMQEVLSTAAKEAFDLLKGLQECSTALTLKTQPVSLQLQQISREI